ncbi:MAG: hypothetical protein ACLQF1_12740 [Methyloceanibacter sp.]
MIPVAPWLTTLLDALDRWQTIIAGLIALGAAIITVRVTLRVERRKADREVDALRKSLAIELRLQITRALDSYDGLQGLSSKPDGPIIARMVESKSRMPAPIIYSANAGKIGFLEEDAMDVVMVYTILEGARGRVDRLATNCRTPDNIDPTHVMSIAEVFLEACKWARRVLPKLRTGDPSYDAQDGALMQRIDAAASQ